MEGWRDAAWWRAVLLGGAVGDALGAPIEFLSMGEIRRRYGTDGLVDFVPCDGRLGAITDDTQMTLFTAEAVLGWSRRAASYGMASLEQALYFSYQRWLATQGLVPVALSGRAVAVRGLVWDCRDVHYVRAPGATSVSAFRRTPSFWSDAPPPVVTSWGLSWPGRRWQTLSAWRQRAGRGKSSCPPTPGPICRKRCDTSMVPRRW